MRQPAHAARDASRGFDAPSGPRAARPTLEAPTRRAQPPMHDPVREPRPSLYYRYVVHEPWLASLQAFRQDPRRRERRPVVIAGAGPAGMVSALELARHGVASVILNAELQVSAGSRAIVFTRRSMEILQQVGVASRVSEKGLAWRHGNSYYRGRRVYRMEAEQEIDDRYFPMLNIQQQYLEEYLLDACQGSPLVQLRWGNKLIGVHQDGEGVHLEIDTPEGPYPLDADWLVAADGGRSTVRAALGLEMEGSSYEGHFVIADIRVDLPLPTERLAFFDPPWNPGNTVLMHREPEGIWRVDYQIPKSESPEQALAPESLKARIDAQLAMIGHARTPWQLDWSSVYSARALTLPDYVHGRVVFAGDAAHLLPIFGVRGANTAFQDAQSLGWQLACVAKGLAGPELLSNYSRERVGAAREIVEEAGKSTRFMAPPSRGFALLRDAVLSLSLSEEFVRPLYHWRTSRAHEYADSALNSPADDDARFETGPCHGAPPRNVRLGADDFLLDHLGGCFDLLCFTEVDAAAIAQPVRDVVAQARRRGFPLRVTAIGATGLVGGADQSLADGQRRVRERYGVCAAGAAYLLRPDQHVCARWLELDAPRLQTTLRNCLPC